MGWLTEGSSSTLLSLKTSGGVDSIVSLGCVCSVVVTKLFMGSEKSSPRLSGYVKTDWAWAVSISASSLTLASFRREISLSKHGRVCWCLLMFVACVVCDGERRCVPEKCFVVINKVLGHVLCVTGWWRRRRRWEVSSVGCMFFLWLPDTEKEIHVHPKQQQHHCKRTTQSKKGGGFSLCATKLKCGPHFSNGHKKRNWKIEKEKNKINRKRRCQRESKNQQFRPWFYNENRKKTSWKKLSNLYFPWF